LGHGWSCGDAGGRIEPRSSLDQRRYLSLDFAASLENLDTELQELNEQRRKCLRRKGEGFDVKILKEIIKLRKQDQEERDQRESLLDLYMRAMEAGLGSGRVIAIT
jgi:uncharacterized protein (UPF0335 family)